MSILGASAPVIPNFGQGSACEQNNGWLCTDWLHAHWSDTLQPALVQHIELIADRCRDRLRARVGTRTARLSLPR